MSVYRPLRPSVHRPRRMPKPRPVHGRARLTLTINGLPYVVRPIACDLSAARSCYRLRRPDGLDYDVSHHDHGHECTCPDFVFRREGIDPGGCKHIKALVAVGLLPRPDASGDARDWPAWTDSVRWTLADPKGGAR